MRISAIAVGAVSARGRGQAAYAVEEPGCAATTAIAGDAYLAQAGLLRAKLARATSLPHEEGVDRATELLADALAQVTEQLDDRLPDWRARRLGISVGTSSGGMIPAEKLFEARARGGVVDASLARRASYFAPLCDALARGGLAAVARRVHVCAACASSTIAIGIGMRWLARGACDLVLAGGYDAVSLFVAAGFEALRAITASVPRPFRAGRDGMALAEGAALIALVRAGDEPCAPLLSLAGFGASCDAVHITAPDRQGGGLARAAAAALRDAGIDAGAIDLVSAHGTATPYNDAAEAKAIAAECPGDPIVHPFKAQIGHTLGAAGVLELLAIGHALERGIAPAAFGDGDIDVQPAVRLLATAERRESRAALKLSAAFGGVAAALALDAPTRSPLGAELIAATARPTPEAAPSADSARRTRKVALIAHASIEHVDRAALCAALGMPLDRLARIDDLGQLALMAVLRLRDRAGAEALAGAGIVGGCALATLDTNERFYRRLRDKGARFVDPRLFPETSPNAGAGHCAIAFGLQGPSFAVNGGLGGGVEALCAAAELIAAGDATRMVVVAADDDGPAARQWLQLCAPDRPHARGATAVLLADATAGAADQGARTQRLFDLDVVADHLRCAVGHLALRAWAEAVDPENLPFESGGYTTHA